MSLSYQEKRLIEQLRHMEELNAPDSELLQDPLPPGDDASASFEQRLLNRARHAIQSHRLRDDIEHAARQSRRFSFILVLVATFTGAMAALKAIAPAEQTLNIYWLLLVLLGFNFVSIALWLVSLVWRPGGGSANSLLKTIWHWIEPRIIHKNPRRAAADRGWLKVSHHGAAGYWWLAGLSHGMWLAYLGAGLLVLLLLLMIRQFDFIWGTTILSDDTFIALTRFLATPLQALGLPAPDPEQIRLSREALPPGARAAARRPWAAFLLGSLLVYGVLPRLLLLSLAKTLEILSRRRYRLDLFDPYYLRLRRRMMPAAGEPSIVDPDTGKTLDKPFSPGVQNAEPPPAGAYWIGVELASGTAWPPISIGAGENLGQIIGSDSLRAIVDKLNTDPGRERVAAVTADRLPDRGLKRTLLNLYANSTPEKRWLAVLCPSRTANGGDGLVERRLRDWTSVATDCGIPSRHLTVIQNGSRPHV